jgi:hypothetical protein
LTEPIDKRSIKDTGHGHICDDAALFGPVVACKKEYIFGNYLPLYNCSVVHLAFLAMRSPFVRLDNPFLGIRAQDGKM